MATRLGTLLLLVRLGHLVSFVIDIHANQRLGRVSPWLRGVGIEDVNHELYGGLYSQMIFGESFEEPAGLDGVSGSDALWAGAQGETWRLNSCCGAWLDSPSLAFNGNAAQKLYDGGSMVNFGLGSQGMFFQSGKPYEGYVYAKNLGDLDAKVTFSLLESNITLGSYSVILPREKDWTKLEFTLTAASNTSCGETLRPRSRCQRTPELGYTCIECSGSFGVKVSSGASVLFDSVLLQPGAWGRFANTTSRLDIVRGLVNIEGETSAVSMGNTVLRLGGSMTNADGYRWKKFIGRPEKRPPYAGTWYHYASGGWRFFEFLQLCEAADIYCVVTMNNLETPADMADWVEYLHGSESTTWGRQRKADGHAAPFKPFCIEIGNEQPLNDQFIQNVAAISQAMTARAKLLGLPFQLEFAVGHNEDIKELKLNETIKMLEAMRPLGEHVMWDFHVGGDSTRDALGSWELLTGFQELATELGSAMKVGVFEENGVRHDLARALGHARQNNRFSRLVDRAGAPFFKIDTTANGLQALSRNNNAWDQGAEFYLPDRVWLSPLGWSQQMISATHQPCLLKIEDSPTWNSSLDVLAVASESGDTVVVRVVNVANQTANTALRLHGLDCAKAAVSVREMWAANLNAVNPPSNTLAISPRLGAPAELADGEVRYSFRPLSFTTVTVACQADAVIVV